MNGIEELWDTTWNTPWFNGSYHNLVEDFAEIEFSQTLGYYQGDYLYVLKDDDRYGFLVVGYGSCSYCDALEGCESLDDVYNLRNSIRDNVKWFDSFDELKSYVTDDNKDLEWYAHEEQWPEFLEKVNNYV